MELAFKPRIRILPDLDPPVPHWCGYWPEGYSSLGKVSRMSLAQAVRFYFRMLNSDKDTDMVRLYLSGKNLGADFWLPHGFYDIETNLTWDADRRKWHR